MPTVKYKDDPKEYMRQRHRERSLDPEYIKNNKLRCKRYKKNNPEKVANSSREWKQRNKERVRATQRTYKQAHRERSNATSREWKRRHPDKVRMYKRVTKYGVPLHELELLFRNPCQICGEKAEHLDHDHKTHLVRGVLCQDCNFGIGRFNDDPVRLRKAIKYLIKKRRLHT